MLKISTAIKQLIESNDFLKFGMSKNLFNLTKLSVFLKPQIEVMTKKELTSSAILMNLSRTQRRLNQISEMTQINSFELNDIFIKQNLVVITYSKTNEIREEINSLYLEKKGKDTFFTITESSSEITIIVDFELFEIIKKTIKTKPKNTNESISAIGIKFNEKYSENPGFLNHIIHTLSFQSINIIEITSTFTELLIYLNSKDAKLAVDLLLNS